MADQPDEYPLRFGIAEMMATITLIGVHQGFIYWCMKGKSLSNEQHLAVAILGALLPLGSAYISSRIATEDSTFTTGDRLRLLVFTNMGLAALPLFAIFTDRFR